MYNESQLRAMVSCINHSTSDAGVGDGQVKLFSTGVDSVPSFPLMLLQGPPGTGKTHTILGMLSLLLAVGCPGDSQKKGGRKVGNDDFYLLLVGR